MRPLSVLVLWGIVTLTSVSPAQALDVCSLVSRSEMAAAFGDAISSMTPDGPDRHKESGSQTWTCTYTTTKGVLAVSVAEFSSTGAARSYVTLENLRKELQDLQIEIAEEKGIGDRAFLLIDEGGLSFTVLKGARYLAVTGGGDTIAPDRLKATLRKIAGILVPKL